MPSHARARAGSSAKLRKVVFPVAGLGTRFLPATKANPKEMLPIVDKPLIQYAVEEAIAAGFSELVFVTSGSKRSIEDHFDINVELRRSIERSGGKKALGLLDSIVPPHVKCIYVRQPQPLGLGHAVLCAKPVVGNEPFAVMLPDDLIDCESSPCLKDMLEIHQQSGANVLAVEEVSKAETDRYGIVSLKENDHLTAIIEKPSPSLAPSNLAVVGRYILDSRIFELLENTQIGAGGEIQLSDAIAKLLEEQEVIAHRFKGIRYDCGSKLGYLQATLAFGLKHPEVGQSFKAHLLQQKSQLLNSNFVA